MKRRPLLLGLLLAAWLAPPLAHAQTEAQPELPKQKLTITTADGTRHEFDVEMALTPQQQETGLMFRKEVPATGGMLFDWGAPRRSQMWMRNTLVPLDMVFIGANGKVAHIAENTVPQSLAIIESGVPVRATLELAAGTARRLGIHVGDAVEAPIFAGKS